ncbi:MAG: hypothetical protein ACYC64_10085 [Armatimonadota bacterium]
MELRKTCALVLFLLLVLPSAVCAGDEISVVAEGVAAVRDGDLAKAEDEALNDAKRNAVEAGVGVLVRSETEGRNHKVIRESILTRSEGYLVSWSRVKGSRSVEEVDGSKLLRIGINAKVSLVKVADAIMAISTLLDLMERPRIRIMVREDNLGSVSDSDTMSGGGLARALRDKGFDISTGDSEILIVGSAKSEKQPGIEGTDVKSCIAHLSAKAIWTQTGEVLYSSKPVDVPMASFASYEDAANRALARAGEVLIENDEVGFASHVIARWADQVQNGRPILLRCRGVTYDEFAAIKKLVRNTRGYVEFLNESFKTGDGELLVKSKLSGSEFREKIAGSSLGKRKIRVIRGCGAVTDIALR